jgi:alkylation response protein AidB-like acyl-CoA dehydrogenase
MNFSLSDDQKMLVQTARDFARKTSPIARMRELRPSNPGELGFEREVLAQMGELGWLGVAFPERYGGMDMSFVELALVLTELGKTLVPEPVIESVVLGGLSVLWAASDEQKAEWLPAIAGGEAVWALAWAERKSRFDHTAIETSATRAGDGWTLSGEKVWVLGGHAADRFVVSARTAGGLRLFAVDRDAGGVDVARLGTIDSRGAAHLRLDGAPAALLGGKPPTAPEDDASILDRVLDAGAAAACAEGLGVAQAALEMTVDYLKTREQFGRPIGSFQALQHRAVDMFVEVELCRSASMEAMIRVADQDDEEAGAAVSSAMVQLATGGRFVVRQAIQLFGGIGITDEHDIGLYFKRMQALTCAFGDEAHHINRFATRPEFLAS